MKRMSSRIGVLVATVGLALTVGPTGAHALTMSTPSLVPDPDGYLQCTVRATSSTPMKIVATILSGDGTNVTEFGTGFRASPAATGDGLYHAEETAGSLNDGARSCKATVTGARRKDVRVTLEAHDGNGNVTATVEAQ